MSRLAIMQPYVFPYIGYFQLIKAVDLFVFYNDVNFIKKSWIHRNRILLNGADHLFTIPCVAISQNRKICETEVFADDKAFQKLHATIHQSYRNAPHFDEIFPIAERVLDPAHRTIDRLAIESVVQVSQYLGLTTRFKESLGAYNNEDLKREERLIDICHQEGVLNYINAIGGKEIYSQEYFRSKGVFLQFLKPAIVPYPQFNNIFVPALSILDVLMFNNREKVVEMLDVYTLE